MTNKGPDVEAVVTDAAHVQALLLMTAYAEAAGGTNIRVRLEGQNSPVIIPGVLESHRPDLVFNQSNSLRTAMIVEVVPNPKELNPHRILLFKSACQKFGADLGFVISKDLADGEATLRYRLASMGIIPQKVWVI